MKKLNFKKIVSICYKIGLKALPICAMAMVVINSNSTSCWMSGQPEPPKSLKQYRKF